MSDVTVFLKFVNSITRWISKIFMSRCTYKIMIFFLIIINWPIVAFPNLSFQLFFGFLCTLLQSIPFKNAVDVASNGERFTLTNAANLKTYIPSKISKKKS
jgi:hypothetical protein